MNSYERVAKALKREQPDRVPIMTYLNGESSNISEKLRRFILASTDVFYTRQLPTGFLCTGIEGKPMVRDLEDGWTEAIYEPIEGVEFAEVYKLAEKGDYIGYRKHLLGEPEDISRLLDLPYVKPGENEHLSAWIAEANSAARDYYASGAFVRLTLHDPICILAGNAAPGDFAIWTLENKDLLLSCMDVILERELEYLDYTLARLEFPPVFNIAGAEYAIPPLMPPRSFNKFVLKYDKPIVEMIHKHDRLVYYHCHGKVRGFIRGFIEMGADGLHPLEPVGNTGDCDLAEVKREFGREICLVGNVQYDDLARLPVGELEDMIRRTMLVARDGGGFILAPSCTPYHRPLPEQVEANIIRLVEAALEHGSYT